MDANGNKTGGRQKGSQNKNTPENKRIQQNTKEFLTQMVNDNQEKILTEMKKLTGRSFLTAIFQFMEYVQPKLSRTEVKAEIESSGYSELEGMSTDDLIVIAKIRNKYKNQNENDSTES